MGYDETSCAHVVRYASRHIPSGSPGPKIAVSGILEPNNHHIADHLHFDGREAKIILATRDYCIVRRCKQTQEDATMEQDDGSSYLALVSDLKSWILFVMSRPFLLGSLLRSTVCFVFPHVRDPFTESSLI